MREITLHDTMQRGLARFLPADPKRPTLYVCGPTVYNYAHIGNARPYVLFGLLARLLRHLWPGTVYARNVTDVDDKINAAAASEGVPIAVITARYLAAFHEDMAAIGADEPDIEPRATLHIDEILAMCAELIAAGHAYLAEGHVLFSVESYPGYGALSQRSLREMIAGARVEVAPYKRHPADFVLWKPSPAELPGWDSPYGRGRPGWHIECSAMSRRHLGRTLDLHAGGNDLIFPHHENEIAQSRCAHGGAEFARHWLHNGFVTVEGRKMSKSIGNVLLIRELMRQTPAEALRYLLLSAHYRQPLDWSERALAQARVTLDGLYTTLRELDGVEARPAESEAVMAALAEDLNTPRALAELHALAREAQRAEGPAARALAKGRLLHAAGWLGLLQRPASAWFGTDDAGLEAEVEALLAERAAARASRDYARADALRAELLARGIQIEDTPAGARWSRIREAAGA